jgi:hypothetical protein
MILVYNKEMSVDEFALTPALSPEERGKHLAAFNRPFAHFLILVCNRGNVRDFGELSRAVRWNLTPP